MVASVAAGAYLYLGDIHNRQEETFTRAEQLLEAGDYRQAAETFQAIHQQSPDFRDAPRALFNAAEILNIYLHRYHEALLAYLQLERDYPDADLAARARRQVAEIYKNRLRDYNRAIVAYQKILDAGATESDRIQYEVADSYFRLNNFEQARIEFDSLAKNYPESPLLAEVNFRIAVIHALEGALEEAEHTYRQVIETWPESPYTLEARFGLAAVLEEEENLVESLNILKELKGTYPNPEALKKKTEQVQERIKKKKKAI